jgi:hypothetical protein
MNWCEVLALLHGIHLALSVTDITRSTSAVFFDRSAELRIDKRPSSEHEAPTCLALHNTSSAGSHDVDAVAAMAAS